LQRDGRRASEAEVEDLGVMLSQRGVLPMPACVTQAARDQLGIRDHADNVTLMQIAQAHRGPKGKKGKKLSHGMRPIAKARTRALAGGPTATKRRRSGGPRRVAEDAGETCEARRHAVYVEHAIKHCGGRMRFAVYDLGAKAANRTNACFWLAFAAAWISLPQAGASNEADRLGLRDLLKPALLQVRAWKSAESARLRKDWADKAQMADDAVGLLADGLRQRLCARGGHLHSTEPRELFSGFCPGPYEQSLRRAAESGFVEDYMVPAVSTALRVSIVVAPAVITHTILQVNPQLTPEADMATDGWPIVYLGTDNVHYVWLRPHDDGDATTTATSSSDREPGAGMISGGGLA
jgi:hypothetical protein